MNVRFGHLRHVARCARRGHRWQEHAKEAGDVLVIGRVCARCGRREFSEACHAHPMPRDR